MARIDLNDYGYVNARIRGLRAHLLVKDFYQRLVEAENFEALFSLLEQTVYRREISEAVLLNPERPDYDRALSLNMIAAFRKILDSVGGEPRRLVTVIMSRYDVFNIKTILRGKRGDATPTEITNLLVPVGVVRMDSLEELAREREVRDVVNTMSYQGLKYAAPLQAAMPAYVKRDQDMSVLEMALDKYHFSDCMNQLKGRDRNVDMVRQVVSSEIDMRNISTLVRTRGVALEEEDLDNLRIPGGTLSGEQFEALHDLGDIVQIVGEYPDPRYRKILEKALARFEEEDVVAFDRVLEQELTRLGMGMSNVDVLGIGVVIGYVFAKQNEVINLRIVLKGKNMEQPQAEIMKSLYFAEREEDQNR